MRVNLHFDHFRARLIGKPIFDLSMFSVLKMSFVFSVGRYPEASWSSTSTNNASTSDICYWYEANCFPLEFKLKSRMYVENLQVVQAREKQRNAYD